MEIEVKIRFEARNPKDAKRILDAIAHLGALDEEKQDKQALIKATEALPEQEADPEVYSPKITEALEDVNRKLEPLPPIKICSKEDIEQRARGISNTIKYFINHISANLITKIIWRVFETLVGK